MTSNAEIVLQAPPAQRVVVGVIKFVQIYAASRYMKLTGEHPIESWKYLPGPQGWVVWILAVITLLCFPLWVSGLPTMLGGLGGLDLPSRAAVWGDARLWGTTFVVWQPLS